jgi:hypothetical protein
MTLAGTRKERRLLIDDILYYTLWHIQTKSYVNDNVIQNQELLTLDTLSLRYGIRD